MLGSHDHNHRNMNGLSDGYNSEIIAKSHNLSRILLSTGSCNNKINFHVRQVANNLNYAGILLLNFHFSHNYNYILPSLTEVFIMSL